MGTYIDKFNDTHTHAEVMQNGTRQLRLLRLMNGEVCDDQKMQTLVLD